MKDIHELMRINGFRLVRDTNHYVYRDGVSQIVMAKTPSDNRAILNQIAELKRACRNAGREFLEEEVRMSTQPMQPFNSIRLEKPKTKETSVGKIKPLDKEALEICRASFEKRVEQREITSTLIKLGYTKPNAAKPIDQGDVSYFMIKNGMRYRQAKAEKVGAPRGRTHQAHSKELLVKEVLEKITDIAMSNINEKYKLDFILQAVKEYEKQPKHEM